MRHRLLIVLLTLSLGNILFAQEPKLMLPIGHTDYVMSASYSPNGKFIVTASLDGFIKQWDAISGQPVVQDFEAPMGSFLWASYSPVCAEDPIGGKYIVATSASDMPAGVWDATSGRLVLNLQGHTDIVRIARFSPDGKNIVTASFDNTAKVWDAKTGKLVLNLQGHTRGVLDAIYSPDGKTILTYSEDGTANVWDAASGSLVITLIDKYYIYTASFSPDGKNIVTASHDSTAKVWDARSGTITVTLKGHSDKVRNAIFSLDGESVLTSSNDNTAKIWDARSGKLSLTLKGHSGAVRNALYSPDGKYILTSSSDSTEKVWDARSGKLVSAINENGRFNKNFLNSKITASFSPNGKFIITFGRSSEIVKVWNTLNGQFIVGLKGHTNYVSNISTSPNGKYIATASGDSTAKIWDIINGKPFVTLKHMNKVTSVSYSPNGNNIVTASHDSTAKIWDASTGNLLADLKGHTSSVLSAQFSPDGKKIVTTSFDSTAKIWYVSEGKLSANLKGHSYWVSFAQFSPDGKKIVTTSFDSTAKLWDASSGLLIATTKRTGLIWNASFSPDSKYIVTCSLDSLNAKVWNASNAQLLATLNHKNIVNKTSFSPDGKYILTVHEDSTPVVWNTISWQKVAVLKGHTDIVFNATFSPDGKHIISRSGEKSVIFWDVVSWNIINKIDCYRCNYSDFKNKRFLNNINAKVSIHDMDTGNKLYTFLAVDRTDYLVYDKDNRYDGTPAARKLIYFTCDREIIELDQVKDQLWVPNLAERIMSGDSINAPKLTDLNICNLTPVVETIDQTATQYRFRVTPRLGGLGATVVYVNGIEVKRYSPKQLVKQKENYQLVIDKKELQQFFVPGKENYILIKSLTAKNSISSRSASISEKGNEKSTAPPNLYAVLVGVSDYKGEGLDLKFAAKDAVDMGNTLGASARKLLNTDGKEHVFIYHINTGAGRDRFPEKNSIRQVFADIAGKAQPNDILLVFFAGHGVMSAPAGTDGEAEKNQFYFLTAEASPVTVSGALKEVGISTDELTEWIKPQVMKAQKRILIFDACNSGQVIKEIISIGKKEQQYVAARGDEKSRQIKAVEKLNERSGMFIISASASDQKAYEMGKYNQGALTYSLLKAIKEEPDILEDRRYLNISRWFNAAEKSVNELARETGARQQPQVVSTTNFNIGVVDEEVRNKIVLPFEKPLFTRSDFRNTELRIDNLKLRALVDKQLGEMSANNSSASLLYSPEYDGPGVYAISGDYTVTGNQLTVSVILAKGGTEIKTQFELKGTVDQLNSLSRSIVEKVVQWLTKN